MTDYNFTPYQAAEGETLADVEDRQEAEAIELIQGTLGPELGPTPFCASPFQPIANETVDQTAARKRLIDRYRAQGFSSEAARLEAGHMQPHDYDDMADI